MAAKPGQSALGRVPLFTGLSGLELESISRVATRRYVDSGEVLCDEGAVGDELFLIVEGEARVDRGKKLLRRLGPGDHFGELALLDRGPRSATVRAATDMTVLVVPELEFSYLLDEVPALSHKLLAALAALVRELDKGAPT